MGVLREQASTVDETASQYPAQAVARSLVESGVASERFSVDYQDIYRNISNLLPERDTLQEARVYGEENSTQNGL